MNSSSSFVFKGHKEDILKGEARFNYEIIKDGEAIGFTERISFPPVTNKVPQALLKSLLDNLMLILGISYWKLYCPQNIVINPFSLSKDQAEFWNTVYTKGMGEFYYKNKIDFRGLVNFPYKEKTSVSPLSLERKNRSLLLLGGGKDSIVAGEMLKENKKEFDVFMAGSSSVQENVSKIMGKTPIVINRELDPKLLELNKRKDIYNGHIPISVIYAFLGLFGAIVYDYHRIVSSNERSANYGNVEYLGQIVNHQWSKSEEFENLFQNYIASYITKDVYYSSLVRSLTELKIAETFSKYKQYFKVFSSCNTNFKINVALRQAQGLWCGRCAKCLFTFALLSAFLSKKELVGIFGKNLFDDQSLMLLFKQLLGISDFKPFECVGTPDETRLALSKTYKKGDFNKTSLMKFFIKNETRRIKK